MPVEIRELIIKSTFYDDNGSENGEAAEVNTAQIVTECVDRVLDVLKEKMDR